MTGQQVTGSVASFASLCTLFPESPLEKMYKKKVPGNGMHCDASAGRDFLRLLPGEINGQDDEQETRKNIPMTMIRDVIDEKAREELVCDNVIELVTVVVRALPDPDRPEDRCMMRIVAEIKDRFAAGHPEIEEGLARVREICAAAEEDVSVAMQEGLLVALNEKRNEINELRQGRIDGETIAYLKDPEYLDFFGPILAGLRPEVTLWCVSWTAGMDDDGKISLSFEDSLSTPDSFVAVKNIYDESVFAEDRDCFTRERIAERIWRLNEVIGEMVG